jgi:cyanophycinase
LISLVLEHPAVVGIGIDESTALVVSPTGPWEIIGASQATVYDARRASITRPGKTLGATDIRVHVLPAGSTFDLATGKATLP